ncbi:MAG: alpha/beta hydrolase, partial [Acidimicrobiia bacterium]|nr:alpha/beta hydrolase [Acidimicrobiia bacterium]
EVGPPESSFAADSKDWLLRIYVPFAGRSDFLTSDELDHFVAAFTAGGIGAPLNYYRNIDTNHEVLAAYEGAAISVPVLMVIADSDPVLPASLVEGMDRWISDLTVVPIEDAGHWVQQERPDDVNAALLDFLEGLT